MIAIAGDHAVPIIVERALQPDRHRFLPDVEVTETANQTEAIKLPRFSLKTPDQQHPLIECEHFIDARIVTRILLMRFLKAVEREFQILSYRSGFARFRWLCQSVFLV